MTRGLLVVMFWLAGCRTPVPALEVTAQARLNEVAASRMALKRLVLAEGEVQEVALSCGEELVTQGRISGGGVKVATRRQKTDTPCVRLLLADGSRVTCVLRDDADAAQLARGSRTRIAGYLRGFEREEQTLGVELESCRVMDP